MVETPKYSRNDVLGFNHVINDLHNMTADAGASKSRKASVRASLDIHRRSSLDMHGLTISRRSFDLMAPSRGQPIEGGPALRPTTSGPVPGPEHGPQSASCPGDHRHPTHSHHFDGAASGLECDHVTGPSSRGARSVQGAIYEGEVYKSGEWSPSAPKDSPATAVAYLTAHGLPKSSDMYDPDSLDRESS